MFQMLVQWWARWRNHNPCTPEIFAGKAGRCKEGHYVNRGLGRYSSTWYPQPVARCAVPERNTHIPKLR